MADRPTDPAVDPAIDPRVEAYLHAELAQAERDAMRDAVFDALHPRSGRVRRRDRIGPIAALAVAGAGLVLVVALGGPRLMGVAATPAPSDPTGSGPSAPSAVDPAATPDPETVVRFDGLSLSADGRMLTLEFTGGKEYEPGNPCTSDYAGWTEVVDGVLHAAVVDITPALTDPPAYECTAEGYGRTVLVTLPEPFTGDRVVDLSDGVTKFVREPADLVELEGLPGAWSLQFSESVDSDGIPRWRRVYATSSATEGSGVGRLELTQGFGGAAGVSGGDTDTDVMVGEHPGVLYRTPLYGELVLVWMLGDHGLAIVANDADFTPDELIALAESAIIPDGDDWGPLAVVAPPGVAMWARDEGTLRITDDCVYLMHQDEPTLLIWPSDQTTWDAATRTVTFTNSDGSTVTAGDGTTVVLGGGEVPRTDGVGSGGVQFGGMRWVAPPPDTCLVGSSWSVSAMGR